MSVDITRPKLVTVLHIKKVLLWDIVINILKMYYIVT